MEVDELEVLPEIEIREIMSLDELLASDTSFVAFSDTEILQYMTQLVSDSVRGKVFHDLFQRLRKLPKHPSTQYVVPILNNRRATFTEETDEEMFAILQDIVETGNAPNYTAQMNEIYKLTYPLEAPPDGTEPSLKDDGQGSVTVRMDSGLYVLLPRDLPQPILGAAYRFPNTTSSSYVHERTDASSIPNQMGPDTADMAAAVPSFAMAVQSLPSTPHELRVHLEKFGYNLDRLGEEDLRTLITRLREKEAAEAETETATETATEAAAMVTGRMADRSAMWKAFEDMLQQRVDSEEYRLKWELLPSSTSLVAPAIQISNDIAEIALGLSEGKFTMEEVIQSLKYQRNLAEYQKVRELLESYQSIDPEATQAALTAMQEKWATVFAPYVDRAPNQFLDTYRDMSELKEGTDTSTYLGDPQRIYFENVPVTTTHATTNADADADAQETESEPMPIALQDFGLTEGARELIEYLLPIIARIQRASALPCNYEAMVKYLSSKIVRISRKEYLDTNVEGLTIKVRNQLLSMNLEQALHTASTLSVIEEPLKQSIRMAWKAWEEDVAAMLTEAITWWVLETQEKALDRALHFDVTQASLACLPKWSPWGPPLQKDKGEGVLDYLMCVAEMLGIAASLSKQRILQSLKEDVRTEPLRKRFEEMGKDIPMMTHQAKAANASLADAVENKQKHRFLPEFVKTYLLLPGLLTGQQAKMSTGCCLQRIGADFKADSDWRGTLKNLRAVKDGFAKAERKARQQMPEMATFEPAISLTQTETQIPAMTAATAPIATTAVPLQDWLATPEDVTFISKASLEGVLRDANQAMTHAEKYIAMATKTANFRGKHPLFPFLKETASWTHYEQVFNEILASLQISRKKYDSESTLLATNVAELIAVKRQMQTLRGTMDEVDMSIVRPLFTYVIARAVCLPAIPDDAKQKLSMPDTVSATFLSNTVKATLDRLKKYITTGTMPTTEQQALFITNMREQQKVQVLSRLDDENVEDRQLLLDMKNLGLVSLVTRPTAATTDADADEAANSDAEAEEEAEEFTYQGTNADQNDLDDLDE